MSRRHSAIWLHHRRHHHLKRRSAFQDSVQPLWRCLFEEVRQVEQRQGQLSFRILPKDLEPEGISGNSQREPTCLRRELPPLVPVNTDLEGQKARFSAPPLC